MHVRCARATLPRTPTAPPVAMLPSSGSHGEETDCDTVPRGAHGRQRRALRAQDWKRGHLRAARRVFVPHRMLTPTLAPPPRPLAASVLACAGMLVSLKQMSQRLEALIPVLSDPQQPSSGASFSALSASFDELLSTAEELDAGVSKMPSFNDPMVLR